MQINEKNAVMRETVKIAIGESICILLMIAIFALCRAFSYKVVLGGLLGGLCTVLNFFFMALSVDSAADKFAGSEKNIKATIQISFIVRMIVLLVCLGGGLMSGYCNPIALLVPICLVRPILLVSEFANKSKRSDNPGSTGNNDTETSGSDESDASEDGGKNG